MGLIKEPIHIDFEVDNKSLTKIEEEQISAYIKKRKAELKRKNKLSKPQKNKNITQKV